MKKGKKVWESPKIMTLEGNSTEAGTGFGGTESSHMGGTCMISPS